MSSKWQYKHAYEGALITIGTLKDENARLREQNKQLRKEYTALRETREREFAASCEAATNSMGQIGTLRDKNAELRELVMYMWDVALHPQLFGDGSYLLGRMRDLGIEVDDE